MLTWEHILKHYHAMARILLLNNGVLLILWVEDTFLKWIWAQFLKQNVSNGERQDMIVLQSDECLDPSMRQIAISDGWMNSSWQKYPKIEKSIRILQPKALDNKTRPTNPGIGCGTFLVCPDILMLSLPRHRHVPDRRGLLGDAKLIIATRPLIYIASTGALYSTGIVRTRTLWERRTWTPHIREGKSKWN